MAFWRREPDGKVRVFYWDGRRQVAVPRAEVEHLDGEPEHNIQFFVEELEDRLGLRRKPNGQLNEDVSELLEQYCNYLDGRGRARRTINQHRQCLRDYALPFLVKEGTNPNSWQRRTPKLLAHLEELELSRSTILAVNNSARGFWTWLCDENHILNPASIRLRNPRRRTGGTPLPKVLVADDALKLASTLPRELRLICLLGYFFSLRPNEVFALMREDFRAGRQVEQLECSKAMRRAGRFSRLTVRVSIQRDDYGQMKTPKASSSGWVACFDETAAKHLVEALTKHKNSTLFPKSNNAYYKLWKSSGASTSIKDLRRASLYYLAHYTKMQSYPLDIQKHARHKDFKTTQLYLRRPSEELSSESGPLSLE